MLEHDLFQKPVPTFRDHALTIGKKPTGGRPHMRAQLLAFAFFATTTAGAVAQSAPPVTQFMSDKDIMGLIEKAKADRKGDAPMVAEPILLLAPYRAQLEYRPGTGPAA